MAWPLSKAWADISMNEVGVSNMKNILHAIGTAIHERASKTNQSVSWIINGKSLGNGSSAAAYVGLPVASYGDLFDAWKSWIETQVPSTAPTETGWVNPGGTNLLSFSQLESLGGWDLSAVDRTNPNNHEMWLALAETLEVMTRYRVGWPAPGGGGVNGAFVTQAMDRRQADVCATGSSPPFTYNDETAWDDTKAATPTSAAELAVWQLSNESPGNPELGICGSYESGGDDFAIPWTRGIIVGTGRQRLNLSGYAGTVLAGEIILHVRKNEYVDEVTMTLVSGAHVQGAGGSGLFSQDYTKTYTGWTLGSQNNLDVAFPTPPADSPFNDTSWDPDRPLGSISAWYTGGWMRFDLTGLTYG